MFTYCEMGPFPQCVLGCVLKSFPYEENYAFVCLFLSFEQTKKRANRKL